MNRNKPGNLLSVGFWAGDGSLEEERRRKDKKKNINKKGEVKALMFVPCTSNSELATRLRDSAEKMKELSG